LLHLQAVMAQHEQNPSGVPDKLSGKNKRQSLSRQAYKQKQRARRNPPSSQAAYQSGMTDPSQPAAAPTSRNPVQQVLGRQADVSMLLRPAAASAATVMTDPGPSAAAPVAHVTNVNDAKQPSGKLGRRQKMRLSFQRQLAAAQAAAVMQQQQQPLKNKSKVDKPASVPTQDASKVLHILLLYCLNPIMCVQTFIHYMYFRYVSCPRVSYVHYTRTHVHIHTHLGMLSELTVESLGSYLCHRLSSSRQDGHHLLCSRCKSLAGPAA